jgi:hypothetical protein
MVTEIAGEVYIELGMKYPEFDKKHMTSLEGANNDGVRLPSFDVKTLEAEGLSKKDIEKYHSFWSEFFQNHNHELESTKKGYFKLKPIDEDTRDIIKRKEDLIRMIDEMIKPKEEKDLAQPGK